jgi:hypothetical protein
MPTYSMGMAQKSDASGPVVANAQIKRSPYHQLETCTLLVLEKKGRHSSAFHSCPYVMFSIIRGRVEKNELIQSTWVPTDCHGADPRNDL